MESHSSPQSILLTSGESLYADSVTTVNDLRQEFRDDLSTPEVLNTSNRKLESSDYLIIEHQGVGHEYRIAVPYSDIADLGSIPFTHEKEESDSPPSPTYNSPARTNFYERSVQVAERQDYPVSNIHVDYMLEAPDDFSWGKVEFSADRPLYCDWEYLRRRSGGINSLGGGVFGFSLSAGWDDSLWSEFKDVVERTQVDLDNVNSHSEVAMSGYVDFLVTEDGDHVSREMDGKTWISGILSDNKMEDISEIENRSWIVGLFKKDSLMFPIETWEFITDPITVFGEVIDSEIATGFGEVSFFVKCRAGAYIDSDE